MLTKCFADLLAHTHCSTTLRIDVSNATPVRVFATMSVSLLVLHPATYKTKEEQE